MTELESERTSGRAEKGGGIAFRSSALVGGSFAVERKAKAEGGIFFEGHGAFFGNADSYNDIIDPGAFKKTIRERGPKKKAKGEIISDIISLWQHNPDWPFGMPVKMEEDEKGLFHRTVVSVTQENMDRLTYMEDRVVKGQSIGFQVVESYLEDEDDPYFGIRHLTEISLWEISPVTFPANEKALTSLIQKNRELARAVKAVDHGQVLERAAKMKSIIVPQIEEALAAIENFGKSVELAAEEANEPNTDEPDTRGDDSELILALERFSGSLDFDPHEEPEKIILTSADLAKVKAGDEGEGYKANGAMKTAASRALKWKEEGKAGGTAVGVKRAHQIVDGEAMSLSTVKRVKAFFDRHETDKEAEGFNASEEGYPSKGRVAWDLWGSDAGWSWAKKIVATEESGKSSGGPEEGGPEEGNANSTSDEYSSTENEAAIKELEDFEMRQRMALTLRRLGG